MTKDTLQPTLLRRKTPPLDEKYRAPEEKRPFSGGDCKALLLVILVMLYLIFS